MTDRAPRITLPYVGDERETLLAFLTWHRQTFLRKLDGLTDEQLRWRHVPSGLTLMGMLRHLGDVERHWFGEVFAGDPANRFFTDDDPDADWRPGPDDTGPDLIASYRQAAARADTAIAEATFGDLARNADLDDPPVNLHFIVVHMIAETARHNGHADLIREAIDGQTGQ